MASKEKRVNSRVHAVPSARLMRHKGDPRTTGPRVTKKASPSLNISACIFTTTRNSAHELPNFQLADLGKSRSRKKILAIGRKTLEWLS